MSSTILWLFAYKYAEYLCNHFFVDENGYSPIQKLAQGTPHQVELSQLHKWGCSWYVLDSKLKSGSMPQYGIQDQD